MPGEAAVAIQNAAHIATAAANQAHHGGATSLVVKHIVEITHQRAGDDDASHQRGNHLRVGVGHGIVVRQHHEQHGQRDVIVVGRALLRFVAPFRVGRLARDQRGYRLRWLGMMTKNTLAVIIVAIRAPVWISAPRPENSKVKTQLVSTT